MSTDYTPTSISDIVFSSSGDKAVITSIVDGSRPFPVSGTCGILLFGAYGTGKTTLARLLPPAIEANHSGNVPLVNFYRIQQGTNGADLISAISRQCEVYPLTSRYHYFIFDEVDNLTEGAMKSLRSVMNTDAGIFILTTNRPNEVEKGVQDRCHMIEFNAAPSAEWLPLFKRILIDFQCEVPADELLIEVIEMCRGSARRIVDAAIEVAIGLGGRRPIQKSKAKNQTMFQIAHPLSFHSRESAGPVA